MCTPTSSQPVTSRAAATLLSSTSESRAADTPLSTTSRATGTPLSTNSRAVAKTTPSTTSKAVATPLSTVSRAVATSLSITRRASPVQTLTAAFRLAPTVSRSHGTQLGSTKDQKEDIWKDHFIRILETGRSKTFSFCITIQFHKMSLS